MIGPRTENVDTIGYFIQRNEYHENYVMYRYNLNDLPIQLNLVKLTAIYKINILQWKGEHNFINFLSETMYSNVFKFKI